MLCRVLNSRLVTRLSTALSIMNQMKMIFLINFYTFIHFFNSYSRPDLGLGVLTVLNGEEGVGGDRLVNRESGASLWGLNVN